MKNVFLLFFVSVLFTSCYSYKATTIAPSEMIVGNRYLIDTNDKLEIRGNVISVNENSVTILKRKKPKEVAFNNIKNIETSKFSTGRTLGLSGIILVSGYVLAVLIAISSVGI